MKKTQKKINNYLQRKSLFGYLGQSTSNTMVIIFITTFGFLFIFRPYILVGLDLKPLLILIIGYSFIACTSFALSYTFFSPFVKSVWTKKLEIGFLALCYIIAWLLIWGYSIINVEFFFYKLFKTHMIPALPNNFELTLLFYTVVIGLLLYLIIHSYDILITYEKSCQEEKATNEVKESLDRLGRIKPNKIKLDGKNDNDHIELKFSQFIAAEVDSHYVKIIYLDNDNNIQKYWLRNSMRNIELQLIDLDRWYRCHRSFIINLDYLEDAYTITSKNTSFLTLNCYPNPIPVSPKKINFLKNKLKKDMFNEKH